MGNDVALDNVLMQELKLIDRLGNKLSITFGDVDIADGYSYGNLKILIDDLRFTFDTQKEEFNIASKKLLVCGNKVWSELCQGPNSGMNADLLDGKHASEFKDVFGTTFFKHMFKTSRAKSLVKVAVLTTKRVGVPEDFNSNGASPYNGIYTVSTKIAQEENERNFIQETNSDLSTSSFHSVGATTPGVFNASLRATVSLLKGDKSTCFDLHLGIFEDPLNKNNDAWVSTNRYFFVSNHNNDMPFIEENNDKYLSREVVDALKVAKIKAEILSGTVDVEKAMEVIEEVENNKNKRAARAGVSPTTITHTHERPAMDRSKYATPPDASKDYTKPDPFSPKVDEGFSYGKFLDSARLYYDGHRKDTIDGVEVITQTWDLYIVADNKTEVHLMPVQSSGCSFVTFSEPENPSNITNTKMLRPKSIYDDRYSHKDHRHYDYEQKIWHIIEEVDSIWDKFDSYVQMSQGTSNANKILMTDDKGEVFANVDNLERHQEATREGLRVLVTDAERCIAESSIKASELAQLQGIKYNIQEQLDEIRDLIGNIDLGDIYKILEQHAELISNLSERITNLTAAFNEYKVLAEDKFVNCDGDVMTGNLIMQGGTSNDIGVVFQSPSGKHNCKLYGGNDGSGTTMGVWDSVNSRYVWKYATPDGDFVSFYSSTLKIGGKKLTISNKAPGAPATGDVWIKSW